MSNRRHDTQSEREHWLAHFEKQSSTAAPFIELEIPARPSTPTCRELVELTFPGGLTLRIQAQTTPQP